MKIRVKDVESRYLRLEPNQNNTGFKVYIFRSAHQELAFQEAAHIITRGCAYRTAQYVASKHRRLRMISTILAMMVPVLTFILINLLISPDIPLPEWMIATIAITMVIGICACIAGFLKISLKITDQSLWKVNRYLDPEDVIVIPAIPENQNIIAEIDSSQRDALFKIKHSSHNFNNLALNVLRQESNIRANNRTNSADRTDLFANAETLFKLGPSLGDHLIVPTYPTE